MSLAIAILGLAFLILIHEAGHFVVARALRMNPRKFYLGFPPAVAKTTRNGIEYGIGAIPLGGYVKIPGMHRPAAGDLDHHLQRALAERPSLVGPLERVRQRLVDGDWTGAAGALPELEGALAAAPLSAEAERAAGRAVGDLRDALGADAYWRAPTWKRVAVIFAGPGTNLVAAVCLFAVVFMAGSGAYRLGFSFAAQGQRVLPTVESVVAGHPAARAGLQPGDRIVAVDGRRSPPADVAARIRATQGAPVTLTVLRDGREVRIGPARPRKDAGEPFGRSVADAFVVTGRVTKAIGVSLANLVHERNRKDISSAVGTVQASSEAVRQGWRSYLTVLGLISLSLALLNLLPLLPLDGGHIAFSVVEGVRRRAVAREVYERVSAVGIALVLLLFVIGLSNDIGRLGGG